MNEQGILQRPKGSIILLHSKERDMDALSKALPVLLKHYGIPATDSTDLLIVGASFSGLTLAYSVHNQA